MKYRCSRSAQAVSILPRVRGVSGVLYFPRQELRGRTLSPERKRDPPRLKAARLLLLENSLLRFDLM